MAYLTDYLHYGSGTECPESYRLWCALSLLGAVAGRKVWVNHGDYFTIYPNLYVVLVGDAGSGKSTAKNDAKRIFTRLFPDQLVSASFQSHQDIIDQMSNSKPVIWKDVAGTWIDRIPGKLYHYYPFYIVQNELASLLSTDKKGMIEFLVDIYDENEFSTGFKGQRLQTPDRKQKLENPFVSVLCCAVPKWFMGNLKLDLFEYGLGRRLIIVSSEKEVLVDNPTFPPGAVEALHRVAAHLKKVSELYGCVARTPEAMRWWKAWYHDPRRKDKTDPILMQFHETKAVQVLKVALLLSLTEDPISMSITTEHLQVAVAMLDALEPNIKRLTSGIGRNELAGIGSQLLDFLERIGQGCVSEVHVRKHFNRYLHTPEFQEVIQHYITTGELFYCGADMGDGVPRNYLMLPHYYEDYQRRLATQTVKLPAASGKNGPLPEPVPASRSASAAVSTESRSDPANPSASQR